MISYLLHGIELPRKITKAEDSVQLIILIESVFFTYRSGNGIRNLGDDLRSVSPEVLYFKADTALNQELQ
jgi:hypothetical protein